MTIPARLFSSSVLLVAVCCVTLMSILNGFFLHHQIYINNIININNIDEDFVLDLQEKNNVGGNAPVSTKPKFYDGEVKDNNLKLGSIVDDTTINNTNRHQQGQAISSKLTRTAIFFNTYIHPNRTVEGQKIIRDQLWSINHQPLLDDTDIYYTRFGDINTTAWPETECVGQRKKRKCHQIKAAEKGDEIATIQALYEYCLQNNDDRVVYMHSKGSYTPTNTNDRLRRFLMEAILSDECLNMPNDGSCSTCSTQFQPFPIFHYMGNMLVAECSYIEKLIPPKDFEKAKRHVVDTLFNATSPSLSLSTNIANESNSIVYVTKIEGGDNPLEFHFRKKYVYQIQNEAWIGINRYAMEHYFLSHPDAKPCEVFSKMDPMVVPFSYKGIKTLDRNLYRIKNKTLKPTLQKIPELVKEQNATDIVLGNGIGSGKHAFLHPFFLRNGRIFQYRALYPESMNSLRKDSWLYDFLSKYSKFDDLDNTPRKDSLLHDFTINDTKFDVIDYDDFDQHDVDNDDIDDDNFDQHDDDKDDDNFDQHDNNDDDDDDDEFFNGQDKLSKLYYDTTINITSQHQQGQATSKPNAFLTGKESKCRCVDCDKGEDNICGGLWRGNHYPTRNIRPSASDEKKIHIVVSHCKASLNWMPSYLSDLRKNVESIHVLSKCGQNVEGAPDNAEIQVIPNVGRNDHAYAYYITSILPKLSTNDDSIVVFLKDTMMQKIFQGRQFHRTDLNSLVQLASSSNGFGCGLIIVDKSWSVYHDKNTLFTFALKAYEKGVNDYHTGDKVSFQSDKYSNVGDFYTSLNANSLPALVQVCYGGMFAASIANIFKHDAHVWKAMEKSLLRGDNIVEGHYAERLWGALLATPLQQFQIDALWNHSTRVNQDEIGIHGALWRVAITKKRRKKK